MKATFLKFNLLFLSVFLLLNSCGTNSDVDDLLGDNTNFYLTAKVGGNNFSADLSDPATWGAFKYHTGTLTISVPEDTSNVGNGSIMINILTGYSGAGTYTVGFGASGNNYARYMTGSMATGNMNSWNAETSHNSTGTGTVTVTSDANNIVEGTFSFTGVSSDTSSKQISEGKFRLKISQ